MEAINEEARLYDMTTAIATAKVLMYYWKTLKNASSKQVDGFILVYSDSKDPVIDYLYENNIPLL